MITGLNHLTLAVSDLARSFDFYAGLLGFRPRARWAGGAYLSCGDLWLCLSRDTARPARDYTHVAFTIDQADMAAWKVKLAEAAIPLWKENVSEGDSIYFLDPDGHRCELHVGNLESRLEAVRLSPYEDLELFG